jgi:hypothetical protein
MAASPKHRLARAWRQRDNFAAPVPVNQGGVGNMAANQQRRFGWLGGFISGVISGLLVSFILTPTGHAAGVYVANLNSKPSCRNPQWLMQVPDDQIFSDSYYFSADTLPYYGIQHTPDYSVDGDLRTAWLQWWPTTDLNAGDDTKNWITWSFPHSYDVRLICIINGWQADHETNIETLPISRALISSGHASNSEIPNYKLCPPVASRLDDYLHAYTYQWQPVSFSCNTNSVTLTIESVAASSEAARKKSLDKVPEPLLAKTKRPLAGLSEVRFYYAPAILSHLPY